MPVSVFLADDSLIGCEGARAMIDLAGDPETVRWASELVFRLIAGRGVGS